MDDRNRPVSREKKVTAGGGNINKRGAGLGTGPVGNTGGYQNRNNSRNTSGSSSTSRAVKRGGISFGSIVVIAIIFFVVKGLFGGGDGSGTGSNDSSYSFQQATSGYLTTDDDYSTALSSSSTTDKADTTVAEGSRSKRTEILGDGKDVFTIMVYMCGTDLESKHGMGTSDLSEMCKATLGTNVNLLVYTGGCSKWKNDVVSSSVNQIYQIKDGGLVCLENDMGNASMVKASTLTEFIRYCSQKYPANRQALIFWDHGGGSLSGYGYDEKNKKSGSMTLAGINTALKDAGTSFDFIGFDACLMATVENALMLSDYADYMIASEETEPGVGWYYTNWLTAISKDTSMPTVSIGKMIIDDYVDVCNMKCKGQMTTLSIVDLAEVQNTVPGALTDFAKSTNQLIQDEQYSTVSNARNNTREFAESSKIDQIDLVDFAKNLNTDESNRIAEALLGAVKYNRTSSGISNANGLSIYFPYKRASRVDTAINTYDAIGMDSEYANCIKEFASLEVSGQVSQGGSNSVLSTLLDGYSDFASGSSGGNVDSILSLLSGMTSGSGSTATEGLSTIAMSFLSGRTMSPEKTAQYLSKNYFDASELVWTENLSGQKVIALDEDQWAMVESIDLNVFVDDGEGFIDLGMDNTFDFDSNGNLIGDYDRTWLAINGQVVAYYHTSTYKEGDNYIINGYVPSFLNGERVELMIVFDNEHPYGYISGAKPVYKNQETDTSAKTMMTLSAGDKLDFICDYYSYDGNYQDSYILGEQMTVGNSIEISNVDIGNRAIKATYRFLDIYQQEYWTPAVE